MIKIYGTCPMCNNLKAQFNDSQVEKLPLDIEECKRLNWDTQPLITYNGELVEYVKYNMSDAQDKINDILKKGE